MPRARFPTAMLEQMKERIRNISQDIHILNLRGGIGAFLSDAGAEVRAQKEAPSSTEDCDAC